MKAIEIKSDQKFVFLRNLAGEIQIGKFAKKNVYERRKLIIDFCIDRFKLVGQISKNAQQIVAVMAAGEQDEI